MSHMPRRSFLKHTLAAAATVTLAGTKSSGRVLGANEAIRIGVAGLHGRGGAHVSAFSAMPGVDITYLIDPDTRTHASKVRAIQQRHPNARPRTVRDVREALQDRQLDALSIAAPNHWHALMTVWAAEAGKHVYVEKPCSHNVKEGRIAVEMARRHNVVVQHGTQGRSGGMANVVALVQSGQLGRLLVSRGLCYKRRTSIGTRPVSPPPTEVDFNLWLGPARQQPFHANLVHYNWHWFWDFGNGDIGNQGVHQIDIARWAIADATLPRSVVSLGGRFGYRDQGETPNTLVSVFDFGPTQLIFEVRGLATGEYMGQRVGNIFHLEQGTIAGNRFFPRGRDRAEPLPRLEREQPRRPGGDHFANFIAAVRSSRREDLNADILEGHYSSALCHLANISYRLGEDAAYNARARAFGDNREAAETLARMDEHLGQGNMLPIDELTYRVGRKLDFDARTETFGDNAAANRLLTRVYRAPFVVPERVG